MKKYNVILLEHDEKTQDFHPFKQFYDADVIGVVNKDGNVIAILKTRSGSQGKHLTYAQFGDRLLNGLL